MTLKKVFVTALSALLLLGSFSSAAFAQTASSSRIRGTVMDSQGAVVPGADVVVKDKATGTDYKLKSGEDGSFTLPGIPVSIYTVTASFAGFKQTIVSDVKSIIGETVNVEVRLEAGAASESVTVTGGAEVLQKETTTIGSTITGRQISELPFTSRNALDLVMNLPGTTTPGRPRTSSVNGLPQGSLNITIDGLNMQDNLIRSGDGFFTYIRPSTDAVAEVTVSTATPGAESAGEGAVQIKFVTKGGTNQYHGNVFWQNRQPNLNANYYFNNLNGLPRTPTRLDQYGFSVGGPMTHWLKDRAFFFVNYERYRLPESTLRSPIVLTPDAANGIFRYKKTDGSIQSVNLLSLAGSKGFTSTRDPIIGARLNDMVASFAKGSFKPDPVDLNAGQLSFINQGGQDRYYTVARLDFNLSSKHHLEGVWNYNAFRNVMDFLNNVDPVFPEPFPQIKGGQQSNRFSFVTALRSQMSAAVVNEARFGFNGGTVTFCSSGCSPEDFAPFGNVAIQLPGAYSNFFNGFTRSGSWRNTPVKQFSDTVNWSKDKHSFTFGGSYTHITPWSNNPQNLPTVVFGTDGQDPANSLFNTTNFPGASAATLTAAAGIYGFLAGRITSVTQVAPLEEATKKYRLGGTLTTRNRAREWGVFVQDTYKFRPNLSINYGLRYEYALPFEHLNNVYSFADFSALFGGSGEGNLFKPGVSVSAPPPTPFQPFPPSLKPYNTDTNNFAPSLGVAWTPQAKGGLLGKFLGEDKTVLRGGYSISYNRESLSFLTALPGGNPGATTSLGFNLGGTANAGSLLFRDGLPAVTVPASPVYPLAFNPVSQMAAFDPNIKIPYTQSWSFGIQRELDKNTVVEARYVGNHAIGIWRRFTPNEVNIFENGFLNEFKNAQNNLAIARGITPTSNDFNNRGLAGQVNLPIFLASFGSNTSTQFTSATNANLIAQGQAGNIANVLARNTAFQANRNTAGLPSNLFVVYPQAINGTNVGNTIAVGNGGSSTYQGLQLELRRRMAGGLLIQGSYSFAKAMTNDYFALNSQNGGDQPRTLRDPSQDKGISPYDTRHALKFNYIYELPFGSGHRFAYNGAGAKVVDLLIGGWASHGIVRWNSGRAVLLTSGRATFNQFESGVVLVGMDASELQKAIKIRKDPLDSTKGTVAFLPQDIIENTLKAFAINCIVPAGKTDCGPTGRYIGPPTRPGELGGRIFFRSPSFFRADLSAVKKFHIRESMNLELRMEFLDAFNNINFFVGDPNAAVVTTAANNAVFGRTSFAYRDLSTTSDPGGRLIQLVARFNF
ncbi:MAG: carboxypeptidase-like regulatory domain-containing protein [Acidobacteriota bacterium]